ncbi:RNA polymerase sigma factor [Parahaliea mediterranea]|uniref:RNA polymerase sigma factor n=1 Tax=Parahaliea mediterranea TaxID=651086 RepID=A0A939DFW7_9GAMM|nr:RNA polymerase sigma factor [Parahaliea mediterranea]MBN7797304.1 RNA polymerase sigma factor [Parahaliea mediterranea]
MDPNKNKLEHLYSEHRQSLQRYVARKIGQDEEAEDVVQETFLRLAAEHSAPARAFARARSPVAYLYRMARNLAVDKLRAATSRGNTARAQAADLDTATPGDDLPASLVSRERLRALEAAVRRLPPKRRQVFVLHKYRQLTYREVAHHLGISQGMVEKHMSQALAQLDRELTEGADDR